MNEIHVYGCFLPEQYVLFLAKSSHLRKFIRFTTVATLILLKSTCSEGYHFNCGYLDVHILKFSAENLLQKYYFVVIRQIEFVKCRIIVD